MHELSIANSLLELIDKECVRVGRRDLSSVEIEIGEFACVERESLLFCIDIAKKGCSAESVLFRYIDVPALAHCINCELEFHPESRVMCCPKCNSYMVALIKGNELKLKSLIF